MPYYLLLLQVSGKYVGDSATLRIIRANPAAGQQQGTANGGANGSAAAAAGTSNGAAAAAGTSTVAGGRQKRGQSKGGTEEAGSSKEQQQQGKGVKGAKGKKGNGLQPGEEEIIVTLQVGRITIVKAEQTNKQTNVTLGVRHSCLSLMHLQPHTLSSFI